MEKLEIFIPFHPRKNLKNVENGGFVHIAGQTILSLQTNIVTYAACMLLWTGPTDKYSIQNLFR